MSYVKCLVQIRKSGSQHFTLDFIKNQQLLYSKTWKSETMIRTELRKSGALLDRNTMRMKWPRSVGEVITFEVQKPGWYWK